MTEKEAESEYLKKLAQMKTYNSPLTYVAIVKDDKNSDEFKIEYGVNIGKQKISGRYDLIQYYKTDNYINDKDVIELLNTNNVEYGTNVIKNKNYNANVTRSEVGNLLNFSTYNEVENHQIVYREKIRPIKGGISIGNSKSPKRSGTLGCLFSVKENSNIYFLSNKHVLCYYKGIENKKKKVQIHNIVQPSRSDASELNLRHDITHKIGETINSGGFNGLIDAEIAKLENTAFSKGFFNCTKSIKNYFSKPILGNVAYKVGRTTLYTQSKILSIRAAIKVKNIFNFENNLGEYIVFEDQIMTEDIASKGDSGSILVDAKNNSPIGLSFADIDFSGYTSLAGYCNIPKKIRGRTFHNKLENIFSKNKNLKLTFKSFLT